ncbi:hypothetical protein LZ32DRAFT_312279 [Colletotrichum eremochloae]|nr:hypothetical protein LZ32DRAFT_312279 [Colletotrichum eremochloae]
MPPQRGSRLGVCHRHVSRMLFLFFCFLLFRIISIALISLQMSESNNRGKVGKRFVLAQILCCHRTPDGSTIIRRR